MNRLGASASAYLQSAAHQPIHWFAWGDEAFAAARADDKPILLDIGAVWCHWCHVMDGESYEDPSVAAILNEHFVCIKVDRDERPDIDARYQRAVQALTQQGGWPLTAFLTPAGDVFYGGTYFPPEGKYQRPGLPTVLRAVLDAYHGRPDQVQAQAQTIRRIVSESLDETSPGEVTPAMLAAAVDEIAKSFDPAHGGFGSQPKFPHPAALTFLMQRWASEPSRQVRLMIEHTLDGMAGGGIHDQLGGGFHRYSVDAEWIVPHFEKMSYDNSELLKAYLDACALFGAERYAEVARGIVRWVRETMADPDGGYAASQDADVGLDDDGDYFTWTREEAAAALTDDELGVVTAHFDLGTAGEMHHNPAKNVLYIAAPPALIARRTGRSESETMQLLDSAKRKLRAARNHRTAPFVDRTRYTNWNAMMASAMLRAGAVLDDAWAAEHALRTLERIRAENPEAPAVAHAPGGGIGFLEDQVHVAAAALDAFEHTGDDRWLEWATRLMDQTWSRYHDAAGGALFDTPASDASTTDTGMADNRTTDTGTTDTGTTNTRMADTGLLPTRAKPIQDAPTPSPNGVAGIVCGRLAELTGEARWRERQRDIMTTFAARAADLGLYAATYLCAADWYLNPATHLVVVATHGATDAPVAADADTDASVDADDAATHMHRLALQRFVPRRVVQRLANRRNAATGTSTGTDTRAPAPTPASISTDDRLRADDRRLTDGRAGTDDRSWPNDRPLPMALTAMIAAVSTNAGTDTTTGARGYACTGDRCLPPADTEAAWRATLDELLPKDPA